jgi:hypothetical protein
MRVLRAVRARRFTSSVIICALLATCAHVPSQPAGSRLNDPEKIALPPLEHVKEATCVSMLEAVYPLPLGVRNDTKVEGSVVTALSLCEAHLVPLLSASDKEELAAGRSLYALSMSGVPDEEVYAYAALLHRFVLAAEMRRVLYFGPSLARLFSLRTPHTKDACGFMSREAALYRVLTPKAFGGDISRGARYFEEAIKQKPACSRDFLLAAEVARLQNDAPFGRHLLGRVHALDDAAVRDAGELDALRRTIRVRLRAFGS